MRLVNKLCNKNEKLAIIGMGYVGMPLALAFSKHMDVIGFDIDKEKIKEYIQGIDRTGEVGSHELKETRCHFTSNPSDLEGVKFFIITVPTPIDKNDLPDLGSLRAASRMVGQYITTGAYVVYESTVYPGATEEVCLPILEESSGLTCPVDFKVGYSPERINPADKENTVETIVKIVSGIDDEATQEIAAIYKVIVKAGIYEAQSIKVAEAAKVAENSQRDINIAFMNELASVFDSMGIDTLSVIEAMKTKWNALSFTPGLVGGHCISVDPYYFIYKSSQLGVHSRIHALSRQVNESMPGFITDKIIELMIDEQLPIKGSNIAMLGVTYKENCPDIRNSKSIKIIHKLRTYGINVFVYDPHANKKELKEEYGITLVDNYEKLEEMDAIVIAVAHEEYKSIDVKVKKRSRKKLVLDVKGEYASVAKENRNIRYWRL